MNMPQIVFLWNKKIIDDIKIILEQCDFPLFIRLLAVKQQFWYACIWMSMFTQQYFKEYPNQNLNVFFKKADKVIARMPDLFNDKLYMEAHGLLWKYGFRKFFENIHYAISIACLLEKSK